jgi:flagellar hook-length control protein FliK
VAQQQDAPNANRKIREKMSSNGLSAAALLMNVTSNERSKIAQKISSREFSHELTQQQQSQIPMLGGFPGLKAQARDVSENPTMCGNAGLSVPTLTHTLPEGLDVRTDAAGMVTSTVRAQGTSKAGQAKARAISQQKAQESLYFTDVVALERIMAQLKLSAEARQACQGTGDKQGMIPFKTLRAMLVSQPAAAGPNGPAQVAAKDVVELVNSLRQVQNGAPASLEQFKTKPAGSYSLNELNDLLSDVVREIADKQQINAPLAERRANTVPVLDLKPASTEIEPVIIPRGQVERLASQRVPTFSKSAPKDSDETWNAEAQALEKGVPSVPLAPLVRNATDEGNPAVGEQVERPMGEGVRNAVAPLRQTEALAPGEQTVISPAEAEPLSGRAVKEMQNPVARGPELQTYEPAVKVLDHHFASDQAENGVRAASRPETTLSAARSLHTEGQSEHAAADVEQLATNERHERVVGLEGRGMASQGNGTMESSRDGEPNDPFRSTEVKHRELGQVKENADANVTGFEKALGEGERVTQARQAAAAGSGESELRLRLTESSWPDELSRKIEESHRQGRSHLTIELEPESLGKLVLRVEADRNHVTAWVSTQNENAKSLLLHGSAALRQHLEEQGLTLGQFTVDVGQQRGEQRFTQTRSNRNQDPGVSRTKRDQPMSLTGLRSARDAAASDRLISVFA